MLQSGGVIVRDCTSEANGKWCDKYENGVRMFGGYCVNGDCVEVSKTVMGHTCLPAFLVRCTPLYFLASHAPKEQHAPQGAKCTKASAVKPMHPRHRNPNLTPMHGSSSSSDSCPAPSPLPLPVLHPLSLPVPAPPLAPSTVPLYCTTELRPGL